MRQLNLIWNETDESFWEECYFQWRKDDKDSIMICHKMKQYAGETLRGPRSA